MHDPVPIILWQWFERKFVQEKQVSRRLNQCGCALKGQEITNME